MKSQSKAVQREKTGLSIKHGFVDELRNRMHDAYTAIARRAYEIFDHDGRGVGHDLAHWLQAESELYHPLHFVLRESDKAVTIRAEVPGFTAKDLEVSVEPWRVAISGQRETNADHTEGTAVYSEHCSNQVFRVLELPAAVDPTRATASLKDGILHLEIPKTAPQRMAVEVKRG